MKFWMVHGVSPHSSEGRTSAPAHRHPVKQEAVDEAKRLAVKHPDVAFYVLESIGYACLPKPDVDWHEIKE